MFKIPKTGHLPTLELGNPKKEKRGLDMLRHVQKIMFPVPIGILGYIMYIYSILHFETNLLELESKPGPGIL